jgi:pilus assembly protein Flp/PilA
MKNTLMNLFIKLQNHLRNEEGQDLVEYALVVALIALVATAGVKALGTDINTAFTTIGTTLNSAV